MYEGCFFYYNATVKYWFVTIMDRCKNDFFFKYIYLVKKQLFYKYIIVKMPLFYIKKLLFYRNIFL